MTRGVVEGEEYEDEGEGKSSGLEMFQWGE